MQIVTIEELLPGMKLNLPGASGAFKQALKATRNEGKQTEYLRYSYIGPPRSVQAI